MKTLSEINFDNVNSYNKTNKLDLTNKIFYQIRRFSTSQIKNKNKELEEINDNFTAPEPELEYPKSQLPLIHKEKNKRI
jgi:hypothetical protein